MGRQFAPPYRRPDSERFAPEAWVLDEKGARSLEDYVPDWDYQQDFTLARSVTVDLDGVRDDCDLSRTSRVRLAAGYQCPQTLHRSSGPSVDHHLRGKEQVDLRVEVQGSQVSGDLEVYTEMTVLEPGSADSPVAPVQPGALLWQDRRSIRLEGGSSRFPVELVSFEAAGRPGRAGWQLDWRRRDLESPVLGALRLLVNVDREKIARAVSAPEHDSETRAIASTIRFEVGRRLILTALEDEEFLARFPDFDEGSLGRTLADLIRVHLDADELEALRAEARDRPEEFNMKLQAGLGIFNE